MRRESGVAMPIMRVALMLAAVVGGWAINPSIAPAGTTPPITTVFVILMENHNWSSIAGNTTEAPYINSLISGANNTQTSYATQYYNPPSNHPSLPNYLWLEAGTNCFSDT